MLPIPWNWLRAACVLLFAALVVHSFLAFADKPSEWLVCHAANKK
jgi:hypothetical protein